MSARPGRPREPLGDPLSCAREGCLETFHRRRPSDPRRCCSPRCAALLRWATTSPEVARRLTERMRAASIESKRQRRRAARFECEHCGACYVVSDAPPWMARQLEEGWIRAHVSCAPQAGAARQELSR